MTEKELIHYGVLGMKWGKRKGASSSRTKKMSRKKQIESNIKKSKNLSDDDLKKQVNRLNMEKQYLTLTNPPTAKAKKAISATLKGAIGVATATTTALTIYNNSDKIKGLVKQGLGVLKTKSADRWV